jgi:EAL domain-containing protein (putative c-di-GMP-specific phosphodiesterase class I)
MSLIKQLWIAIILITGLSLGGSFVVSTLSARHYLEQELAVKNMDNATSLALSLSQMPKDPVTVELQVAAQFDAGHYRLIRLTSPTGDTLVEREYADAATSAPDWFVRLVPIVTYPGLAQVQDGWHQFGTLSVETHSRYAYESLWSATHQLLLWFIGGGILTGLIGTVLLKLITRPLDSMVEQAEAIGGRRFVTTPEPRTREFRSVVRAMNALSERVRTMLAEESRRLELLRRQTQHDELTGLFNRNQFLNQLDAALSREDASAGGTLLIARVHDLVMLNQRLGRAAADRLLVAVASALRDFTEAHPQWDCGRLNATDFALLAPGPGEPGALAASLGAALNETLARLGGDGQLALAAGAYTAGEARGQVLARVDGALAAAEQSGATAPAFAAATSPAPYQHMDEWQVALRTALDESGIELARFPVLARDGALIHYEAPVRLTLNGRSCNAGQFMPWAARLGLMAEVDRKVAQRALAALDADRALELAINLSVEAMRDASFRDGLYETLHAHPDAARRLWVEVPEHGALRHQVEFRALCLALRPLGCRVGLEHAGQHFSRFAELHDLGLDYIKISAAFVRDIDASPGNMAFLRGLCTIAHSIGLITIAEGVGSAAELGALPDLGIDGMTGPAVKS